MKTASTRILSSWLLLTAIAFAASSPGVFQMRLVVDNPTGDSEAMSYVTRDRNQTHTNLLQVQKTVLLNQTALKSAKAAKDALGQSVIEITFTEVGAKQFAEITRENLNKRLAIIIYGQVCQAPIIRTEVTGGKAQISGAFSNKEAKMLARKIAESLRRD